MGRAIAILATVMVFWGSVSSFGQGAVLPDRWRWSNPRPHGNHVVDMAYSALESLGIQVSERGQLYTSTDLATWVPRESGTTRSLRGVCFLGGRILVTGEEGTVLYADTPDLFESGTLVTGPTTDWLESVTASGNLAVAVGDRAAVYVTLDGADWRRLTSGVPTSQWLRSVAYGVSGVGGRYVAVGDTGTVITSPNGTNWTLRTSGTSLDLNRVSFGNGKFFVVGSGGLVLSSQDGGASWSRLNSGASNDLFAVTTGGADVLVAGDNEVRTFDGVSWVNELLSVSGPPRWTYYAAIGRPGFFLLSGRTGMTVEGYQESTEPYLWVPSYFSPRAWLFDLVWMTNLFVAVGDSGTVMTSGDGVDWVEELVPSVLSSNVFLGIGGTTNLLVAAGDQGALMISPNDQVSLVVTNEDGTVTNRWVSTLGVVWQAIRPAPVAHDLQGVTYWNGQYVVSGASGTILTSPNGSNWTLQATPTTKLLSGLAGSPGRLVACGDRGTLLTSLDAVQWSPVEGLTTNWVYRVRWLSGVFVAVGQGGLVLSSPDGVDWTRRTSPVQEWLNDATWIADTWYVVGTQGTVLASTNLSLWATVGTITQKSLYGAAVDGRQMVVAGVDGAILRAPLIPDLTPIEILDYSRETSTNGLTTLEIFLFGGKADQRFRLDHKGELGGAGGWVEGPELEFFDGSGTLYYLQSSEATNVSGQRYYLAPLRP